MFITFSHLHCSPVNPTIIALTLSLQPNFNAMQLLLSPSLNSCEKWKRQSRTELIKENPWVIFMSSHKIKFYVEVILFCVARNLVHYMFSFNFIVLVQFSPSLFSSEIFYCFYYCSIYWLNTEITRVYVPYFTINWKHHVTMEDGRSNSLVLYSHNYCHYFRLEFLWFSSSLFYSVVLWSPFNIGLSMLCVLHRYIIIICYTLNPYTDMWFYICMLLGYYGLILDIVYTLRCFVGRIRFSRVYYIWLGPCKTT